MCLGYGHVHLTHLSSAALQLGKASQRKRSAKRQLEGHIILHRRAQIDAGKVALQAIVGKETDAQL